MQIFLSTLPLLLPIIYIVAGFWFRNRTMSTFDSDGTLANPKSTLKMIALCPVGLAVILLAAQAWQGSVEVELLTLTYLSVSLKADLFGSVMTVLVTTVGATCLLFSRRYLAGDPGQANFLKYMVQTLACVITLILSNTLFLTVLAWIAMSLSLHRLLLFYPERAAAQRAASKKYIAARIGDLCLLAAATLLATTFGTDQIDTILATAKAQEGISVPTVFATLLIVAAALMKTAQFPFNGWLLEVMETPTPVSAMLHAGVVNAGGFLVIRFSDLITQSPEAMWLLALVGGTTAVIGSLAMVSQTSVKVGLAWSTVAQMGLMILQCGLGAFSAAALHIIAHSLYKAHAFLTAGSVIDKEKMPIRLADWRFTPTLLYSGLLLIGASLMVVVTNLFDMNLLASPGGMLVMGLFILGTMHLICAFLMLERINIAAVAGVGVMLMVVSLSYGAAHEFAHAWLGVSITSADSIETAKYAWTLLVLAAMAAVLAIQWLYALGPRPAWLRSLLIHAANGFYASAITDRVLHNRRRPTLQSFSS